MPDGRERRRQATHRALCSAALELGLERGLGDVRIEEIAERAGVSTRHPVLQSRQTGEFSRFEARPAAAIASHLPDPLRAGVVSGSCITAVRVGLQEWALEEWRGSPRPHVEVAFAVLARQAGCTPVIALDTRGGVQPYTALGLGLRKAGHEVRMLCPPTPRPGSRHAGSTPSGRAGRASRTSATPAGSPS